MRQARKAGLTFRGYIRGHPLWTPFPLKLAKDNNVRAFCKSCSRSRSHMCFYPIPGY